jgi:hypothetical protein
MFKAQLKSKEVGESMPRKLEKQYLFSLNINRLEFLRLKSF